MLIVSNSNNKSLAQSKGRKKCLSIYKICFHITANSPYPPSLHDTELSCRFFWGARPSAGDRNTERRKTWSLP